MEYYRIKNDVNTSNFTCILACVSLQYYLNISKPVKYKNKLDRTCLQKRIAIIRNSCTTSLKSIPNSKPTYFSFTQLKALIANKTLQKGLHLACKPVLIDSKT